MIIIIFVKLRCIIICKIKIFVVGIKMKIKFGNLWLVFIFVQLAALRSFSVRISRVSRSSSVATTLTIVKTVPMNKIVVSTYSP